jgi:hypothetical protein
LRIEYRLRVVAVGPAVRDTVEEVVLQKRALVIVALVLTLRRARRRGVVRKAVNMERVVASEGVPKGLRKVVQVGVETIV